MQILQDASREFSEYKIALHKIPANHLSPWTSDPQLEKNEPYESSQNMTLHTHY